MESFFLSEIMNDVWVVDSAYWNCPGLIPILGLIPTYLNVEDPRSAKEQFAEKYGWRPMKGFTLSDDDVLHYPGDPDLLPRAFIIHKDDLIIVYDYAWVVIMDIRTREFEVSRMD
jgi:hypothetical protein